MRQERSRLMDERRAHKREVLKSRSRKRIKPRHEDVGKVMSRNLS
jgi:hypothetical protein